MKFKDNKKFVSYFYDLHLYVLNIFIVVLHLHPLWGKHFLGVGLHHFLNYVYMYCTGFLPSPEEFIDFYHETKGIGK